MIQVAAQDPAQVQRLFEAGQFAQVVQTTGPSTEPSTVYLAAQSQQKLAADGPAKELYGRLAARPATDPWHFIGVSGQALVDKQLDPALAAAQQAITLNAQLPQAQFQLGLAQAARQAWNESATAFDRAAELSPADAYAHYYGGLMHYRANRTAQMAVHFEQFLKLAPEAPERPEVLQIMRTIRGR